MREKLTALLNNLITILIAVVVFLTPLLFTSSLTEFYEMPKVIFFVSITVILITLWALSWVLQGRVTIARTPLDVPLLVFIIVVAVSAFVSPLKFISFFGNLPRLHGSAASWIAYGLFYFVAASHLKNKNQVKMVLYALMGSGALVSLLTLMSYFGLYLPISYAKFTNFTPTGSSFSTAAFLTLLLPLPLLSLVEKSRLLPKKAAIASAAIFLLCIALVGTFANFVGLAVVLGLLYYIVKQETVVKHYQTLAIPAAITAAVLLLSFIPSMGKFSNPLYNNRVNFPREIQLPVDTSWKVSVSAFRDKPFLGTGPNTYLFDFTQYKPIQHNSSRFWNLRFDAPFNEFLHALATLGGIGLLSLVFLCIVIIANSWKTLTNPDNSLSAALSISAIAAIAMLAFRVSSPVLVVIFIAILALIMAIQKTTSGKVEEISIGIKASRSSDQNFIVGDILPFVLFLPILVLAIVVFWNLVPMVQADWHHREALKAAATRGIDTYNHLIQAERLNPRVDLYRTDIAQTNFALANAIAAAKGPNEASPGGSLTDQDRQNIQQLLSQAITEGRVAVALNPQNPQNWEVLGSIYRQISGVAQNALLFALDSYGRAIQADPLNPLLRLNVGGVYYSIRNYDLAIRFFTDAINLKSDFANAYYNLSVALRDKGDIQSAIITAERVVSLLKPDNPDYKAASDYLAELKNQAASGSAQQSTTTAPAAEQTSSLQEEELPKVIELPEKQDIATPAAVKKPEATQQQQ